MSITPPPVPTRSSDGRFELSVEEFWDRASVEYTTYLKEVASGAALFSCQGAPKTEFLAGGMCLIHYFGYQPHGIVIQLDRREFRLRESDPWLPLVAWPAVEGAYGRGWSASWEYRGEYMQGGNPWVDAGLATVCLVAVMILLRYPLFFGPGPRVGVCVVAASGFLLFAWMWLSGIQIRRRMRAMRNPRRSQN